MSSRGRSSSSSSRKPEDMSTSRDGGSSSSSKKSEENITIADDFPIIEYDLLEAAEFDSQFCSKKLKTIDEEDDGERAGCLLRRWWLRWPKEEEEDDPEGEKEDEGVNEEDPPHDIIAEGEKEDAGVEIMGEPSDPSRRRSSRRRRSGSGSSSDRSCVSTEEEDGDHVPLPPAAAAAEVNEFEEGDKKKIFIIKLPFRSGTQKDTPRLSKNKENFLKKRNLCVEFPLDVSLSDENARGYLLDQIIPAARILCMDEIELYFVGGDNKGPFSPSNELESLNLVLSSLNSIPSGTCGDRVVKLLRNAVCDEIKDYAIENPDKYSDNEIYTQFDEDSEKLLQWGEEKGVKTSHLRIACVSESGRGAVASKDIEIGETVLEIPESLIISTDRVHGTVMYEVLKGVKHLTPKEMLMLWIMKERDEKDSTFATYFQTLPHEFKTGLNFGEDACKVLKPTDLHHDLWRIQQAFERQIQKLTAIVTERPDVFPPHLYARNHFFWARQLLDSYSMKIVSSDGEQKTCLIPIAGIFNHSLCPHLLRCDSVDRDTKSLKFVASRPCKKGQQCYISYGNLPGSVLVTSYGFLPKGVNHHDVLHLGLDLDSVRHEVIVRGDGNVWREHMVRGSWFSNGGKDNLSEQLLNHLHAYLGLNAEDDMTETEKHKEVLEYLCDRLSLRLEDGLEDFEDTDKFPENTSFWDVKLALSYRDLFKKILSSVVHSCEDALERFMTDEKEASEELVDLSESDIDEVDFTNTMLQSPIPRIRREGSRWK